MGKKVIVWGDSIARGVIYDAEHRRYRISPCAAHARVADETGMEITCRAHMGMTAGAGLARMRADLERGMRADSVVLEFGGNDCDFDWRAVSQSPREAHIPKTPIAEFERDTRAMIELARSYGMAVSLCTLPPILSDRYFAFFSREGLDQGNLLSFLGEKNTLYRFHERYSLLVARLAREYDCRLLDLRAAFLSQWDPRPYICEDGIHPSDAGQLLMSHAILEALA